MFEYRLLIKLFYENVIRDILVKVVRDNNYEWDDKLLSVADYIFNSYREKEK